MVMSENCPGDEIHCTCVPLLRIEITDLRKQLAEAQAELASAKDITQYHIEQRKRENKLITTLRKQLAEAQAEVERCFESGTENIVDTQL